jgi:hypothetical protein
VKRFEATKAVSNLYGEHNDCAVTAVSCATGFNYQHVHALFAKHGRRRNGRTPMGITEKVVRELGFRMVREQVKAKSVVTIERELMKDRSYLIRTRGHILAFAEGCIQDWTKGRRHHVRQVYWITK